MKILFLIFHGFNASNGISKKIHYQIHAFQANCQETHLCYLAEENGTKYRMLDDTVLANYGKGIKGKICKRIEFDSIRRYAIRHEINLVYLRSDHNANPFTLRLVHKMKKAGIHIVMEIPTYPYDQEYSSFSMKLNLFIDRCFRKQFAKYLDRIITFSNYSKIFGIPTLQLSNGIDFNNIPIKQRVNDTSRQIHLIGVAEIHYWHGYDRLIKGLANYYTTRPQYKVYFHIVGKFTAKREYEACIPIIKENQLDPYIILHGPLYGEALNSLFEQCDMGVGSLGRHRSGITNIKTLKNREYAARGIPFIYSEIDEDFEDMPYILKIPANEDAIDVQQIINFYNHTNSTPTKIRESIKHLSWNEQMNKVIEAISPMNKI